MFFILGAVIVIDVSALAIERAHLSASVDAATLAASQTLFDEYIVKGTNNAGGVVEDTVEDYLSKNNQTVTYANEIPSNSVKPAITINTGTELSIEVTATKSSPLYFAKLFKLTNQDVTCSAKVVIDTPSGISGVRPFSLESADYNYILSNSNPDGENIVIIKDDETDTSNPGNFKLTDLDGNADGGTDDIKEWITNGYDQPLNIGDEIYTQTGNVASVLSTIKDLLNANGGKITIVVPIVTITGATGNEKIIIEGFAAVELSYYQIFKDNPKNNKLKKQPPGKTDIIATFVETIAPGNISTYAPNYGTYAAKLVK